MNVATLLTLLRVLLAPVFMFFVFIDTPLARYSAAVVFIFAAATDLLDGHIARHWRQVTKFGKVIDPVADKFLVSAALISLVQLGSVSAWAAVIIIGREFAVSGLRMLAASEGVILSASVWGKWKTVSQMVAILTILLRLPGASGFLWLSVAVTVWSGIEYFMKGQRFLRVE